MQRDHGTELLHPVHHTSGIINYCQCENWAGTVVTSTLCVKSVGRYILQVVRTIRAAAYFAWQISWPTRRSDNRQTHTDEGFVSIPWANFVLLQSIKKFQWQWQKSEMPVFQIFQQMLYGGIFQPVGNATQKSWKQWRVRDRKIFFPY